MFFLVLCRLGIRVRVRVRISLGLGLTRFIFLSVWVRLNPLIFSCRAPAKTAVRHLSPRGGGGDRQLSDARHPPGLFSFFYPVRVRNFGSKLGLGIRFHCVFRSPDLDLKALEDLAPVPL